MLAAAAAAALTLALPAGANASARRAVILLAQPSPASRASAARVASANASALVARRSLRAAGPAVPEIGMLSVRIPRGEPFARFARRLERDSAVRSVEPDRRRRPLHVPTDPAFTRTDLGFGEPRAGYQWYLEREGFPAAWDLSRGTGVLVGVVDSGIDTSHPDLGGKVAALRDHDPSTTGTGDELGHGTHVAGLACASSDNGVGMAGAGLDCELLIAKSDLTSSSTAASIVDLTDDGARVINMSFGGGRASAGERRALRYAFRRDVLLVAAAADDPVVEQGHPAKDLQPTGTGNDLDAGSGLVVTAADASGGRASFAGRGTQISLAAFGDTSADGPPGIFSTYPANTTKIETGETRPPGLPCPFCRTEFDQDTRYGYLAGTSMAAPQVAGAAALVRAANPRLSNVSVMRVLKRTARREGGWSNDLGWGVLDAGGAVSAALDLARDTAAPVTRHRGGRSRRSGRRFTLRWSGRDLAPPGVAPSGIESYRVFARQGRGRYRPIASTRSRKASFTGDRGHRYSFYVQARDRAGNLEAAPAGADFVVRVRRR